MADKLINGDLQKQISEIFNAQLNHAIEIIYFSTPDNSEPSDETKLLLEELSSLSEKIFLKAYRYDKNPKLVQQYNLDLAPSLVIAGHEPNDIIDYGIRFAGIPAGYEFSSLIQAIILVSRRDSGLKPETRRTLHELKKPVNLKVFATPT